MTDENQIQPDDLNLIDDHLDDATKDDAALWAEFDTAEAAPAADAKEQADDAADVDDEPQDTEEADADEAPAETEERQEPDIWANATPELKQAYESLRAELEQTKQSDRSQRGRVSALQRQINELMASQAAPKNAAEDDGYNDEELARIVEEYPEVAKPITKKFDALETEIDRLKNELAYFAQKDQAETVNQELQQLSSVHPDWQDIAHSQDYAEWLSSQAPGVQALNESYHAADAITLLNLYKAAKPGGGNAQHEQSALSRPSNNKLAEKRQRQLQSAAAAKTKGPGVKSGIPEDGDPEVIWRQFDEMERRNARF